MKPSFLTIVLLFLYLTSFVISTTDLMPEVLPTSNELAVNHSLAYGYSGIGTPAAVEECSNKLVSLRGFSDQWLEMLDPSSTTVTSICSSMENSAPGSFLLALFDGTILSVDCKSGIQWSLQTGSALSYSEQFITEIDNSGCFLYPGEDWKLYEYCTGTGLRKLNLTIEEYVHNTPEIRGTEITVGSKMGTTYLLDADTGKELYKEQHPFHNPVSAHKFVKKLVPPELKIAKNARNYIIIVRTDYYLNSSVLGTPNWNMMESRISATYVNNKVSTKASDDLNLISPYQMNIPVYFQRRRMNNAIMAGSGVPMLPSATDFHYNLVADAKVIYQEALGTPYILPETTDVDKNLRRPAELYFYVTGDSSKDASECSSGNCIMFKALENKASIEVANLQPRSSRPEHAPFEDVLGTSNDSFILADNNYKNISIHWNLEILFVEALRRGLQIFMAFSLIAILVMYFCKTKEPNNYIRNLNDRGRVSISPKKRRARKPVNMKSSAVTTKQDEVVAEKHSGTNQNSKTENSDTNLFSLLRCNIAGEGKWVGKLFVSNTEIGRGSNGTVVFEGVYDGRIVAVKRLLRAHHDVAFKEIQNLIASDRHPNIVRWYGVEEDLDFVYISLEYCISSLNDLIHLSSDFPSSTKNGDYSTSNSIKEHKLILPNIKGIDGDIQLWRSNGFPSPQLLKLMSDVVSGVAHLHELGIIHRDLKPQNVLVGQGKILTAKVSDMGISKRLLEDMSSLSQHATGHGSSGWRAPEQLRNGRQSRAVDLFSLGCILFFCMTKGEHPFGNYYERDMNIMNNQIDLFLVDHIPEAVDLLLKLLNSEPKLRPNAIQVLHHPLFWSSEMRLTFIRDVSDRIELEDRDNGSELLKALENASSAAFGGKWGDKLDDVFIDDMGRFRKYNFDSMRDLLRVIRNKQNHYRELSKDLKEILGPVPEGFDQYFSTRFPRLLIEVYKVICFYCREEDSFRKYFASTLL